MQYSNNILEKYESRPRKWWLYTLIVFIMALRRNGLLAKFQHDLGAKVYDTTAAKRAAQSTK